MKKAVNIGNVVLVLNGKPGKSGLSILLGLKRPKTEDDNNRRRKKVGSGLWVPPGGATNPSDKSQKHAARREVYEETGLWFPLKDFRKAGILKGYICNSEKLLWLVHLYTVSTGQSDMKPKPNEEFTDMRWFKVSGLPFAKMLPGDKDWIPRLINGKKLLVDFNFDYNTENVISKSIRSTNFC